MKPSTKKALNLLRSSGWVSGNRLFEVAGTRYGGRLFELRHDFGLTIEKRPAPNGSHVPEYRLVEDVQLSLTLATNATEPADCSADSVLKPGEPCGSVVLASVPRLYIARSVETSVASGAQLSLTLERAS